MKDIKNIATFTSGLVLLAGLAGGVRGFSPGNEFEAGRQATQHHVLTLDLAVDCRTLVSGPNRGDGFIINGKLFPAGTLPSGMASNDPTKPVNGVAPIGEWLVRGQHAFPLPATVAPSYSAAPGDFATQYYILNGGRTALTAEGYAFLQNGAPTEALLAITGGIGALRGATGDIGGPILGPNVTGCPNARVTFNIVPGSIRGPNN